MRELNETIADVLRGFGLFVVESAEHSDLRAHIPMPTGVREVSVHIKERAQSLGPAEAARWADQTEHHDVILALPHVTTAQGRLYEDWGINYVDSGGNAHLDYEGFFVHVEGRKPKIAPRKMRQGRAAATNKAGMRVVFVLLIRPEAVHAPYDEIARLAGVSRGSVFAALADLRDRKHLLATGHHRQLVDPTALVHEWVDAFASGLLMRLNSEVMSGPPPDWWREENLETDVGTLGGGLALEHYGAPLRPDRTLLYGRPPWPAAKRRGRLHRDELSANVILREQFWSPDLLPGQRFVPPLLAYADGITSDDPRDRETARGRWPDLRALVGHD